MNEVVFHHSVSLKYLKAIWVDDWPTYINVSQLLWAHREKLPEIDIQITGEYLEDMQECDMKIEKKEPNPCFYMKKNNDDEFIQTVAKSCGFEGSPKTFLKMQHKSEELDDITEIREYLLKKGVSKQKVDNLSDEQINDLAGELDLVTVNFLRNQSVHDQGKGRKKSPSKKKLLKKKSQRKSAKKIKKSRKKIKNTTK